MVTYRTVFSAALLALAAAVPVSAEWWKVGALGGSTTVAAADSTAMKAPVKSAAVPEPADFALFAAGVAGLLLGRRGSRSRKRRDDTSDDE